MNQILPRALPILRILFLRHIQHFRLIQERAMEAQRLLVFGEGSRRGLLSFVGLR